MLALPWALLVPVSASIVVVEAEQMERTGERSASIEVSAARGGSVLVWEEKAIPGETLSLTFDMPEEPNLAGNRVFARFFKSKEAGLVRLAINGHDVGWPIDLFALSPQVTPPIDLGVHGLRSKGNQLTVFIAGANAKTKGPSNFGLDALEFTAPDAPPPGDWMVSAGPFEHIYDPSVGEDEAWYINDHSVIRGPDGNWHLFGITREEPPNWMEEQNFAHATSPALTASPWKKEPFAITADYETHGEVHLWAPYVLEHEGIYYMYYCAGGGRGKTRQDVTRATRDSTNYRTHLAISKDLRNWERHEANPMFTDGWDARDPMVIRLPDDSEATDENGQSLAGKWVLYYTATDPATGGNYVVAYRTSDDLINWSDRAIAFRDPVEGKGGGTTESPFVIHRDGWYYLFIAPRGGPGGWYAYAGTDVFRSRNPVHFELENIVGHIPAHAGEVVHDEDGNWFITHCGWGQGGVYVAPLRWHD